MSTQVRPKPVITDDGRPFWDGCQRKELLLQHCKACGKYQFPPRVLCSHCWSTEIEWRESKGEGEILSFTVLHFPSTPAFSKDIPYCIALITLKEGPQMLSRVVGIELERISIGMKVEVIFEGDEFLLPYFKPQIHQQSEI